MPHLKLKPQLERKKERKNHPIRLQSSAITGSSVNVATPSGNWEWTFTEIFPVNVRFPARRDALRILLVELTNHLYGDAEPRFCSPEELSAPPSKALPPSAKKNMSTIQALSPFLQIHSPPVLKLVLLMASPAHLY